MPTDDSTPITEAALSEQTGISRSVIAHLRKVHLTPDDDFGNVPKSGITLTGSGLQKIKAALAPLLALCTPTALPMPADSLTLVVLRPSRNGGRSVECRAPGHEGPIQRLFCTVPGHRLKASTLTAGQILEGCTPIVPGNPEVFEYHGPVPARLGHPIPAKKDAALS